MMTPVVAIVDAWHSCYSEQIEPNATAKFCYQPPLGVSSFVSISLDHAKAKEILFEEVALARAGNSTPLIARWLERVRELGVLCPHGKSATVIAALGTALLAKATDPRIDVYSLLDRGEAVDSYSARSLADNVWARHRAELGIDLGANGTNPLNNTPFIGKTRIDEISGVRNRNGWACFLDCIESAKSLRTSSEARAALRGFIFARVRSLIPCVAVDPHAGDELLESQLLKLVDDYVAEESEGGRRAQAVAAAMLDAAFGISRVVVGVINDPDRHAPLDISVTNIDGAYEIAFEIKDKPILDHHFRSSIEKTVIVHHLHNLAFVAVSRSQKSQSFDGTIQWAARHGVKMTVFFDWKSLFQACKCFAQPDGQVFEGKVFRRILVRGMEIGVASTGLEKLRTAVSLVNSTTAS